MTIVNTEVTASFQNDVRVLGNNAEQTAIKAHAVGITAVQKAYSGDNLTYAQYVLDNSPKYVAKALTSWFKRAGIDVMEPLVGESKYIVNCVVDKSRQAKVFKAIKTRPVIETVMKVTPEPKAKVLKGTAEERAQIAVDRVITSLKKADDELAASIVSTRTAESFEAMTLISATGAAIELESADYNAVVQLLEGRGIFIATNTAPTPFTSSDMDELKGLLTA